MSQATKTLRRLLQRKGCFAAPACYHPLGGRLVESLGFPAAYNGGYVTGASQCITEPLLTLGDQVSVAGAIARSIRIPLLADGGAGFGEPLHTMRTVREFIRAGVAGIHIEDQHHPKRAHYHKYVERVVSLREFQDKIALAAEARKSLDPDFVLIARTDTCRTHGAREALKRVAAAAEAGADLAMLFPRNHRETLAVAKGSKLPLVYVNSHGNRDGRPLYNLKELEGLGFKVCIDAILSLLVSYRALKACLEEVRRRGEYTGAGQEEFVRARKEVEDLIGLEEFYRVEERTVERGARGGG